jgi:flavin reductase (DIM6/NTAB) family NADH-FMN oxidoreductase RutF
MSYVESTLSPPTTASAAVSAASAAQAVELAGGFKNAMRQLAGGVALIATQHEGVRHGITMTAVSSLTMDPPALLISVNRHASAFDALVSSGRFSVNLLREAQAPLAAAFSRKPDGDARFATGRWRTGTTGVPVLEDGIAAIECRLHDVVEFGTHAILIGVVEAVDIDADLPAPLIYLSGQFGSFHAAPSA